MRFSIVTPSLNQAAYLPACVESVLRQQGDGVEVQYLIRDGGSTDGTLEWLHEQEHLDWVSAPDGGQANAVNLGLEKADGEILGFLNSDDLYEPCALAAVAQAFSEHPEADFVYGDYYFMEGPGEWRRPKVAGEFSEHRLRKTCFLSQPATFWRKSTWDKLGPLDAGLSFAMDYEYWLRASRAGCHFHYLPQQLAAMRMHSDSKTCSALPAAAREHARVLQRHYSAPFAWVYPLKMTLGGQYFFYFKRRLLAWWGNRKLAAAAASTKKA